LAASPLGAASIIEPPRTGAMCSLMDREPLTRSFYDRDVVQVARDLLGRQLVRASAEGITSGRIVEVEAYLHEKDSASHAFRGRTRSNAVMFGPPAHAYVFSIHSRFCLNAVAQPEGTPAAVLIRAVEPQEGVALMQQRRGVTKLLDVARGPARLCEAFAVDRRLDGWDLTRGSRLWIASGDCAGGEAGEVTASSRIGVTSAQDLPLRFFVSGNRFVSGPRSFHRTA
jgi:DNA-3-methyladenine glycosylase